MLNASKLNTNGKTVKKGLVFVIVSQALSNL